MSQEDLAKVDSTLSASDGEMEEDAIERLRRELTSALEEARADEDDDYMLGVSDGYGRNSCFPHGFSFSFSFLFLNLLFFSLFLPFLFFVLFSLVWRATGNRNVCPRDRAGYEMALVEKWMGRQTLTSLPFGPTAFLSKHNAICSGPRSGNCL